VAYGDDPAKENVLEHGELITAVEWPHRGWLRRSHYLKVRDRASFEFALVSVAAALEVKDGKITEARVALGGVATKPWRAVEAEKTLVGQAPREPAFDAAAKAALRGAKPQKFNAFKVELCRRAGGGADTRRRRRRLAAAGRDRGPGRGPGRPARAHGGAARGESYADILHRHRKDAAEATRESKQGPEGERFSMRAFGAQFVEVRVDADLGTVRVTRFVCAIAAGRIVNPKTARSQAIGGVGGGLGMGLLEETVWDPRNARIVNANFADYHVPVHADVPPIDVIFVDERDEHVNPVGAKGIAELALVGVAPAVANAVYHATGKRVRDLPITPDNLL
jgi:CO/xanthine dehydrogenase Mo-binding subunit